MFCLSYVCVCASCCWVELFRYTVVFYVCCGHLILSKFQPAKVLLSGLIFTCPVPSPTVMLRVKSTLLMEFIQTTKVCEQERYQITQTSHFLVSAWLHVGWVCMYSMMWCPSLLERCHLAWMIHLSVSQQMHFIVTTTIMLLLLDGHEVDFHVSTLSCKACFFPLLISIYWLVL